MAFHLEKSCSWFSFPLPMTPGHVSDLSHTWVSTLLSDFWSYINVTPYSVILKSKVKFYKYENQASISENQRQENPGGHNMGTFLPCVTNCAVLLIFPAITFSNSASPPFLGLIHPLDIVWIKQSLIKRRIRSLFWMRKNITIYSSPHLKKILLYIF